MNLELQIAIALLLDFLIGDPPGYPHPVRLIGKLAQALESAISNPLRNSRLAGFAVSFVVLSISGGVTFGLIKGAALLHPLAGDILSCLILYTCLSVRDLAAHALRVNKNLKNENLHGARESVGWMVGRNTKNLDETSICRATVESVAENLVDGVTAPLLMALIGGPVAAVIYKAASTMDSMFGYKNERYGRFGWFSARLDDLFNLIPARLTMPFIVLSTLPDSRGAVSASYITWRDSQQHASPNSGISEAAFAGALGLQLGGASEYPHGIVEKPTIGDPEENPTPSHIVRAVHLMIRTTILFAIAGIFIRIFILNGGRLG